MTTRRPDDIQDQYLMRSVNSASHEPDGTPDLAKILTLARDQPAALEQPLSANRNRPPWVAGGHG
jgi:hypothetical protein